MGKKHSVVRKSVFKTCLQCGKVYEKHPRFSLPQWNQSKFCSIQCSANNKKINDGIGKSEKRRIKNGSFKRGTPAWIERIKATTKEAMYSPSVQEKIRAPRNPLTKEHRDKISGSMKGKMPSFIPNNEGENNHFFGKPRTDEMKKIQSDKLAGKMPKNLMYDNSGYSNIKRGYYDINGTTIFFRSKWEANYALYLDFLVNNGDILGWDFEPDTFVFEEIKFGTRSYTPDFRVIENNSEPVYHEVKGYMDSRSKTKFKRMEKYFPDTTLILIDRTFYMDILKKLKGVIKFYK